MIRLGELFDRDHTTVVHAIYRIEELYNARDKKVFNDVENIRMMMADTYVVEPFFWGS
jgi:chromosomal replication initiation ATPase DnaA